jgi:uncharacterized protein with NRDE domain
LAIYFHCSPAFPVVIAANRDEFYERPTVEPRPLSYHPWIVAGQDLQAGGTWFGVNQHRVVVGMLNRRTSSGPDPRRRSRGLLCIEALQHRSPAEVVAWLDRERANAYNAFNLLVANDDAAFVVTNDGEALRATALPAGLHLLTNLDLNDPTCPRIATSHRLFAAISLDQPPASLIACLQGALANHDVPLDPRVRGVADTLCIHSPAYGTRSSSIVLLPPVPAEMQYWHAPGAPCTATFSQIPLPSP